VEHFRAHQRAAGRLFRLLDDACPDLFEVFFAPLDFQPTNRRSAQPDVLVVSRDDPDDKALRRPPLLVAEVLSPSTKTKDLLLKKYLYETSGVPHFWVVDPGLDKTGTPAVTVYALVDAAYQERRTVRGAETLEVTEPFRVRVRPPT
jgi:Uma2 family endonuclease